MLVVVGLSFLIATLSTRLLSISLCVYSAIELIAALTLYHRLVGEEKAQSRNLAVWNARDRQAEQFTGFLLYAMILCVLILAAYSFTQEHHSDVPPIALALAYVVSIVLPFLAKIKHGIAMRIGSRALRLNSVISFAYGYLCLMILAGLSLTRIHDWWIDTVGALMILPMLTKEAIATK